MTRRVFLILGAVLLAYIVARIGPRTIADQLIELRWTLPFVLVLYATHQAARAWALTLCIPGGRRLGYADGVAVRLAGEAVQFLTFSGPILSEPTKARLLQARGLSIWEGLAATLAEYVASSLAAAVMAVCGVSYVLLVIHPVGASRVAAHVILWGMAGFVALVAVGLVWKVHLIGALVRTVAGLPGVRRRLAGRLEGLPSAENMLIDTLGGGLARLVTILTIEGAGQVCLGVELWLLLRAVTDGFAVGASMLLEGCTKFMTAGYFFVPGQVGVAEGSYAVLFGLFGLSVQAGVAVSFVRRLRSIVTAGAGLVMLARLKPAT